MPEVIDLDIMPPVFQSGQPPEQLHEAQFGFAGPWGENNVLKRASQIAGSMHKRLGDIHQMRVEPNPADTPAIAARKVKQAVEGTSRDWAGQWQDVKDGLKRERSRVEGELTTAANLKANPDYRNAILGVFTGLRPEKRIEAIQQAVAEGDGPTVATLLEAPQLVTGLTAEQKAAFKAQLFERANASGHALLKQLDKALVRAEAASLAAIDASTKLLRGTDRFDKQIERATAREAELKTVHLVGRISRRAVRGRRLAA